MSDIKTLEAEAFGMTSTVAEKPSVLTMEKLQPALDMLRKFKAEEVEMKAAFLKLSFSGRMAAIAHAQQADMELPQFCRNTARLLLGWHEADMESNRIEDQPTEGKCD